MQERKRRGIKYAALDMESGKGLLLNFGYSGVRCLIVSTYECIMAVRRESRVNIPIISVDRADVRDYLDSLGIPVIRFRDEREYRKMIERLIEEKKKEDECDKRFDEIMDTPGDDLLDKVEMIGKRNEGIAFLMALYREKRISLLRALAGCIGMLFEDNVRISREFMKVHALASVVEYEQDFNGDVLFISRGERN